jgi:hypothetical protein
LKRKTKLLLSFGIAIGAATLTLSCLLINREPDFRFDGNKPFAPFQDGCKTLDYVLARADTMPSLYLLAGAATAFHLNRLQDGMFLFYAGLALLEAGADFQVRNADGFTVTSYLLDVATNGPAATQSETLQKCLAFLAEKNPDFEAEKTEACRARKAANKKQLRNRKTVIGVFAPSAIGN